MTTEKKYYKRDPKSPFYEFMADTSVEDSKSLREKERRASLVNKDLCFNESEADEAAFFERDYMMYCILNDVPKEVGLKNLLLLHFSPEEINNFMSDKD